MKVTVFLKGVLAAIEYTASDTNVEAGCLWIWKDESDTIVFPLTSITYFKIDKVKEVSDEKT